MGEIAIDVMPRRKVAEIEIAPQGIGGYDACWYPVAWSHEIAAGMVEARAFLNGQVAVYRTKEGKANVVSSFCSHLGADLSMGAVIGDTLRCPFHHWRYNQDGRCVSVTGTAEVPAEARIFAFPTEERHGLIWAFNGMAPSYAVPHWPQYAGESLLTEPDQVFDVKNDPFVLCANSVDFQHLKYLHGLPFPFEVSDFDINPHSYFSFHQRGNFMGDEVDSMITVWGTNVFTTSVKSKSGRQMMVLMAANLPLPGNRSRTFSLTGTPVVGNDEEARAYLAKSQVEMRGMTEKLLSEDGANMESIHFRVDNLSKADVEIHKFLEYSREFPRYDIAMDYLI